MKTFEERVQASIKTRILWCLVTLFDMPSRLPKNGEKFGFISGRIDVTYSPDCVATRWVKGKHPLDEYGNIFYEKRDQHGNLYAQASAPPHRICRDTWRVRKLIQAARAVQEG